MKATSRLAKILAKPYMPPVVPEAKNAFLYLLTADDEFLSDIKKAENVKKRIDQKANEDALIMKEHPVLLPPWMRDWVRDTKLEDITSFRRDWYSCAISGAVQNTALKEWEDSFADIGKEFLDRTDGWKNIVEKDFGGVKAMYYREEISRGGAAYYKVPASIMALAPSVSVAPSPQAAVQILPQSGGAHAPV